MTKRKTHIVILLWVLSLAAVALAPYAFADKQHPARTEKTVQLEDVTHFEGVKLCNSGPECPQPWLVSLRAPQKFTNGDEKTVQDNDIIPDATLVDRFIQDLLDGGPGRSGMNKQRGLTNGPP